MNVIFKDKALEELYSTRKTKDRRYSKYCRNSRFIDGYVRVVTALYAAASTQDLKWISYLHYEKLRYGSLSSIRIVNGMVERLLFTETEDGVEVELIEINNTHYGNKK